MTDYTPDTDNLFCIYESQAAAAASRLRAWVWEIKIKVAEDKLKAAKGGEA